MGSSTTISDIAKKAGVGYGTASRALSGQGSVSEETKAHILKVAKKLNYQPNRIARSLASGRSEYIALFAAPGLLSFFGRAVEAMESRLREAGYTLLLHTFAGTHRSEIDSLNELMERRVAGVIVAPGILESPAEPYNVLLQQGIKVVVIDRLIQGLNTPQVIVNNRASIYNATKYLISLGHRRIGHLAPPDSYLGRERIGGFKTAMIEAGLQTDDSLIISTEADVNSGEISMTQMLNQKDLPTAIVTRSDDVAVGAMKAIFAIGLSVPDDISIISHGDTRFADMLRVPLTTMHVSAEQMIDIAVDTLLKLLHNVDVDPQTISIDTKLILRESCTPC